MDYIMDISGKIELSDYSNIFDYINIINKNDNFTIRINKNNKKDIDLINSMLSRVNLNIYKSGYDAGGNYCITAKGIV